MNTLTRGIILLSVVVVVSGVLAVVITTTSNRAASSSTVIIRNVQSGGIHFEGPHWSTSENALYWVDMDDHKLYRYDYEADNVTSVPIGYGSVSLAVSVKDNPNIILVTVRSELYFMRWDTFRDDTSLRLLTAVDLGSPGITANDGKVDAMGRLWFGTKGTMMSNYIVRDEATLYMMDHHNYLHPQVKLRPVSISNGIAWNEANTLMFYIDSLTNSIDVFDFNLERGVISNRRVLFGFQANNMTCGPDGMTIDSEDNLWVACLNGWKVLKIDTRTATVVEELRMPVEKIASVMFGGPDLATLFVSTGRAGLTEEQLALQPEAGSLFAVEGTGARGRPENQFVFPNAANY